MKNGRIIEGYILDETDSKIVVNIYYETGNARAVFEKDSILEIKGGTDTMTQKNMIELLLHSNLVSQDMINEATFYQNSHDCGILQYLVWKGHLNDDDLARIMSTQFGFPYVTLEDDVIPDEVIAVIPVAVAKKYLVLPVDRSGNDLTVFMVNPFDDEAISEIEKISGCKVQKFVGVLSDILNAIEKYYKVTITEKLVKEKAQDTRFKPLPPVPDTAGAGNDEPVTGDGGEHLLNIPGMDLDIENHDDEPREETAKSLSLKMTLLVPGKGKGPACLRKRAAGECSGDKPRT
jgi:hypothetical protein